MALLLENTFWANSQLYPNVRENQGSEFAKNLFAGSAGPKGYIYNSICSKFTAI